MAKILLSDPWAAISGRTSSDDKVVFRPPFTSVCTFRNSGNMFGIRGIGYSTGKQ